MSTLWCRANDDEAPSSTSPSLILSTWPCVLSRQDVCFPSPILSAFTSPFLTLPETMHDVSMSVYKKPYDLNTLILVNQSIFINYE